MARGWESKSVESQIESAESKRAAKVQRPSPEELQRARERESLELSRTRVLHDIEAAHNPKYRDLLQASLKFLDEKIAGLSKAAGQ